MAVARPERSPQRTTTRRFARDVEVRSDLRDAVPERPLSAHIRVAACEPHRPRPARQILDAMGQSAREARRVQPASRLCGSSLRVAPDARASWRQPAVPRLPPHSGESPLSSRLSCQANASNAASTGSSTRLREQLTKRTRTHPKSSPARHSRSIQRTRTLPSSSPQRERCSGKGRGWQFPVRPPT